MSSPQGRGAGGLSAARRRGLMRLGLASAAVLLVVLVVVALASGGEEETKAPVPVFRDAADTRGPLDILSAEMDQDGPNLVLRVRTAGLWTPGQLAAERGRSLCTTLFRGAAKRPSSRVCVVSREGRPALELRKLDRNGKVAKVKPFIGTLRRRNLRQLEARFSFAEAGLPPGRFRWQVETSWAGSEGCAPAASPIGTCEDRLPDDGASAGKVVKPLLVGCTPGRPTYVVQNGPRTKKVVALTFDDGPGDDTPKVLDILDRQKVPATFFILGSAIEGRERSVLRALDRGDALANHTWTHVDISGGGEETAIQMSRTNDMIRKVTKFEPCLFRAPFGSTSAASNSEARRQKMNVIQWDVDTNDYQRPGAEAIVQTVLSQVKPGSIVLMHDGGGDRSQTVAALPEMIKKLRAKGYDFVTVTELLGLEQRYA